MVKVSKALRRILIILITLLIPPICIFGISGGVYAAAETEEQDSSGIMRELSGLTIDGKKFDADNYPALGFGNPRVLYLNEVGYNFYANKQDNYQLTLYIYNPAQLALKEDVRNTVQLKAGNAARYDKYALKIMDASADKLFYKFSVDFTAAEKSSVLSNLDKESRKYIISSLEFYIEGYNAKDFAIGRTYTFTGYGAGMDDKGSASPTLATTLSYTVTGEMDPIKVEVHHTSWRPEGTNGNSEYTQDTIHSVYFAVPNSYAKEYDYLNSVSARWIEARTAPILVTGNKELLQAYFKLLSRQINSAVLTGNNLPEKFDYTDFDWQLVSPVLSSAWAEEYEVFFGNDYWYKSFNQNHIQGGQIIERKVNNRIEALYLIHCFENGSAGVVTSSEVENAIKDATKNLQEFNDKKVANKYPSYLFESYDTEFHNEIIELGVTDKKLNLNSEEVKRNFWEKVFGGSHVTNPKEYENVEAIKVMTDALVDGGSDSLYISERDYEDFKTFYKDNKDDSTVYLMRFAVSEYWRAKVNESQDVGFDISVKRSEGYFAQETCYLDFDILDFEYKKNDESYIIPVSMSPIDIFPELTPPVETKTGSDFWIYGVVIIAALIVVGVVYGQIEKVRR